MRVKVDIMLSSGAMQEVLDVDVDEHTDWKAFVDLLRALLEAETRIKQLIEEEAEAEEGEAVE